MRAPSSSLTRSLAESAQSRVAAFGITCALALSAGCQTAREDAEGGFEAKGGIEQIATTLVSQAEVRVDLSATRITVEPIFSSSEPGRLKRTEFSMDSMESAKRAERLSDALREELSLALSRHMNVIDVRLSADATDKEDGGPTAPVTAASHVLVGDYVGRGETILLTVRLVDSRTKLIVATARGEVLPRPLVNAGATHFLDSPERVAGQPATPKATLPVAPAAAAGFAATPRSSPTSPELSRPRERVPAASLTSTAAAQSSAPGLTRLRSRVAKPAPSGPGPRPAVRPSEAHRGPLTSRDLNGIGEPATPRPINKPARKPKATTGSLAKTAPRPQSAPQGARNLVEEARRLAELPAPAGEGGAGPAARRLRAAGRPLEEQEKP